MIERRSFYGARVVGYEMAPIDSVDVDTPADLDAATSRLSQVT
jgi:hypothetical protein